MTEETASRIGGDGLYSNDIKGLQIALHMLNEKDFNTEALTCCEVGTSSQVAMFMAVFSKLRLRTSIELATARFFSDWARKIQALSEGTSLRGERKIEFSYWLPKKSLELMLLGFVLCDRCFLVHIASKSMALAVFAVNRVKDAGYRVEGCRSDTAATKAYRRSQANNQENCKRQRAKTTGSIR